MYLQVRNDYMRDIAEHIDHDIAVRLGCIEMRYSYYLFMFLFNTNLIVAETVTAHYYVLLHNIDFGSGIKPFNKYKYFH